MKKLLFIFVPIIYGLLIYTISPNSFFSNTKDIDGGTKYIQSLLKKNEKDPLNIAFENLLSKVPSLENNFKDMLVYHHHLWIKNNKILFYDFYLNVYECRDYSKYDYSKYVTTEPSWLKVSSQPKKSIRDIVDLGLNYYDFNGTNFSLN